MTDFREARFQPGQRVLEGHPEDAPYDCTPATIIRPWDFGTWWGFDIRLDDGTVWEAVPVDRLRLE